MNETFGRDVDVNLRKVFGSYFTKMSETYKQIVNENTVEFGPGEEDNYKYYYKRTLHIFPKATFLATSRPDSFLWEDETVLADNKLFLQGDGHIERIFFLPSQNHLRHPDVQEMLKKHHKMKVNVYTAVGVPKQQQRLILVEKEGRIAWEMLYNDQRQLISAKVTTNQQKVKYYCEIFEDLCYQSCKYTLQIERGQKIYDTSEVMITVEESVSKIVMADSKDGEE